LLHKSGKGSALASVASASRPIEEDEDILLYNMYSKMDMAREELAAKQRERSKEDATMNGPDDDEQGALFVWF